MTHAAVADPPVSGRIGATETRVRTMRWSSFGTVCAVLAWGIVGGACHLYIGEEAVAVGVCANLENDDCVTSTHRGHGHAIAKGADLKPMLAELMGRATGYCHGCGGSMHIFSKALGLLGGNVAAYFMKTPPVIPFDWVLIGLVICSLVGVIFGTYPAFKAANLDPIDSLRYE